LLNSESSAANIAALAAVVYRLYSLCVEFAERKPTINLENALENHANGAKVPALAPDNAEVLLKNSPEPRKPGFQPGNRANPLGRPRGAYSRRMSPLKRMLDFESKEILKKVVTEARNGNMQAAALVLSRTLPRENAPSEKHVRQSAKLTKPILATLNTQNVLLCDQGGKLPA
jgi:hypothetical protein